MEKTIITLFNIAIAFGIAEICLLGYLIVKRLFFSKKEEINGVDENVQEVKK